MVWSLFAFYFKEPSRHANTFLLFIITRKLMNYFLEIVTHTHTQFNNFKCKLSNVNSWSN